eukprot:144476_1
MGNLYAKSLAKIQGSNEIKVVIVGLDATGKTTILNKLKFGEIITTIPTIGCNIESIAYGNITFVSYDIYGGDKIRPIWRHYCVCTTAVIFVVDSNDKHRIDHSKDELHEMFNRFKFELEDVILLVLANKQDLPYAMDVNEVTQRLELHQLENRSWNIQGCSAITNEGLWEGIDWLTDEITKHSDLRKKSTLHMAEYRIKYKNNGIWNINYFPQCTSKERQLQQLKIEQQQNERKKK